MPAVATAAGAFWFLGEGVVEVEPLAAVVVEAEAVVVHCLSRTEMPERAVKPAPLPCTRNAGMTSVREAPGFRKNWSSSVLVLEDVEKFSIVCLDEDE